MADPAGPLIGDVRAWFLAKPGAWCRLHLIDCGPVCGSVRQVRAYAAVLCCENGLLARNRAAVWLTFQDPRPYQCNWPSRRLALFINPLNMKPEMQATPRGWDFSRGDYNDFELCGADRE